MNKSAPCKCCPSGGSSDTNCVSCLTDMNANSPYTLTDSYYGGSVTMTAFAGGLTGTRTGVSATGHNSASGCCSSNSITIDLEYDLDCGSTLSGKLCLWVYSNGCGCSGFGWRGDRAYFGLGSIGTLGTCLAIDATHVRDCQFVTPMTFTFSPSPGTNGVYPSGATVTISK